jgi:hypothetical protein
MVKINEFHDMDIPDEILPKPDFDVSSDLLIFMRNDPMFYRKNFFPAIEQYRRNTKNTGPIESMIKNGLNQYCTKFNIQNPVNELIGSGDIKSLVAEIIADEMQNVTEGWMARTLSGDPEFKAWMRAYKKDPRQAERMVGRQRHQEYMQRAGWS